MMDVDYPSVSAKSGSDSSYSVDSLNGSFNIDKSQRCGHGENNKYYNLPLKSGMIVLLDHPASFTVYQYVSIQVLSGSVSVLGYEITSENRPLEVFSSEKTGLIEIKTETYDRIWKRKSSHEDLRELFNTVTEKEDLTTTILSNLGNSSVALFVKRISYPINLQFLELYFPQAFDFNLYKKKATTPHRLCVVDKPTASPIQFNDTVEQLICQISMLIRSAKLTDDDAPRVIVFGPRNSGKSSLIRYMVNKILSTYIVAYYLDADPGQTEFTPPGVVSLSKVIKPIIGPAFCHQKDPLSMVFTGSVSPSSPDMYSKSISKLMRQYFKNYRDEVLFVNTMGWMEGFGLKCLENVMTIVKPTVMIEITTEDETSMFDYRDYLSTGSLFFQIGCSFERKNSYFSPKEMREMALLSYFGKCQSPFLGPVPLNVIRPYRVSWDKIPIYIFHQKVQPYRMIEAISSSIVALCRVPESNILKSEIPQFPLTLDDEPDNECIGFGFVRAIDETAHLLYIITPLQICDLNKVNAVIKGDIVIPDTVILNQDIYEEPLPYTNNRCKTPPPKTEIKDRCKVSTLHESNTGTEFDISDMTPRSLNSSYRKKIPKRYNRHK